MAAPDHSVNLAAKAALLTDPWSPRIVAAFNDLHVKVVKVQGAFVWHDHPDTDELFLVLDGTLRIELDGADPVTLGTGDLYVVPRGVRHRPIAEAETHIALIEPAGVPNTGDPTTATRDAWI